MRMRDEGFGRARRGGWVWVFGVLGFEGLAVSE